MKSLMLLWKVLLEELGEWCDVSTSRDSERVAARIEHEGLSFLAITLPAFAKDLERGLEQGRVSHDLWTGFRRKGELPEFLGGFLDLVFDRSTGVLLSVPSVDSIFALRQICMVYGKMQYPNSSGSKFVCSKKKDAAALAGYVECEKEVMMADDVATSEDLSDLNRVSALLFRDVFALVDRDVYEMGRKNPSHSIVGKHGPGSTADRLLGNQKFDLAEWPARLELEFPYGDYGMPSPSYNYRYDRVLLLEPGAERPVKVTLVPKTPKTPRIICIEPTAMQFMQQGLAEKFMEYLEADRTVLGMVGFKEQGPNQVFAREGSLHGDLATLDLKEASDRVSDRHVLVMLSQFPALQRAVGAVRSRKAVMPDKSVLQLVKFASMGSALCFPFEAMVFLAMIFLGVEREESRPLTRKTIKCLSGKVRVYGDDLIVPVQYVDSVIETLVHYGYRVNTGKSFWNGKFRESCGKDYYDGIDVTTTRARRPIPASLSDVSEIISAVSLRNQLYIAGLWKSARHLDEVLAPLLRNKYPPLGLDESSIAFTGKPGNGSPLLGRQSYLGCEPSEYYDCHLQSPLVKGWHIRTNPPDSPVSGEGALMKFFLKRGDLPFADERHLERQGRPKAVSIKPGWKSPY